MIKVNKDSVILKCIKTIGEYAVEIYIVFAIAAGIWLGAIQIEYEKKNGCTSLFEKCSKCGGGQ